MGFRVGERVGDGVIDGVVVGAFVGLGVMGDGVALGGFVTDGVCVGQMLLYSSSSIGAQAVSNPIVKMMMSSRWVRIVSVVVLRLLVSITTGRDVPRQNQSILPTVSLPHHRSQPVQSNARTTDALRYR